MLKAYKFRLYPNKQQIELIDKHIGCVRWVYNYALEKKMKAWNNEKKNLSRFDIQKELPMLKKQKDTEWLKEVNGQSLQASLENLDKAYTRFFRKTSRFPKFKRKRNNKQSFQIPQYAKIDFKNSKLILPKIKAVNIIFHRKFIGIVKTITVSKTSTNKYFASILVDTKNVPKKKKSIKEKTTIGLDLGIKHFITSSNGDKIENPKVLSKYERKLIKTQRKLSRKKKGSKNRDKQRLKLAKIYEKISNARSDFLHKVSYQLTHENQTRTIVIEDLNIQKMQKNHKLAKSISDCGWNKFVELLKYKSEWYGINLIEIGRFEPSSKLCSNCGIINHNLKLSDRDWKCSNCKTKHDRDINAAINIKHFGLNPKIKTCRDGTSRINASGEYE